jgi:hypothetical protein
MSAPNFQTQNDFDLYVFDENYYFDEIVDKDYKELVEEELCFDFEIKEDIEDIEDIENKVRDRIINDYYDLFDLDFRDIKIYLKEENKQKFRPLEFFEIGYESDIM